MTVVIRPWTSDVKTASDIDVQSKATRPVPSAIFSWGPAFVAASSSCAAIGAATTGESKGSMAQSVFSAPIARCWECNGQMRCVVLPDEAAAVY